MTSEELEKLVTLHVSQLREHVDVVRIFALVDRLGNALREQNERWGLYGNESQQALEAFEEMKASAEPQGKENRAKYGTDRKGRDH